MIGEQLGRDEEVLGRLIQDKLKLLVKKIDTEAYYPLEFLRELGTSGLLRSQGESEQTVLYKGVRLVEETAKTCMTTAFNLWCQLAAQTYLRHSDNPFLHNSLLPELENGQLSGGTGLSNPMKFYGGLEKLILKAKRVPGGYSISGQLPSVSNLGPGHWFGCIAQVDEEQRVMAFVPCDAERLQLRAKLNYLGLNGSGTYACDFQDVFVKDEWVIAEQADAFVEKIRSAFVLFQIPLGLGVIDASIRSINQAQGKQSGCNQYLPIQSDELEREVTVLREKTYQLTAASDLRQRWGEVISLRLAVAYLTSKAVHAGMLHHGGAAYLQNSDPSRRLRESYFLVNLTPTIKHLEKLSRQFAS